MGEFELHFELVGQCTSGKNAVIVTRTGMRFPSKRFVDWRKDMMEQILPQIERIKLPLPIPHPVSIEVVYTASDRIRRDVPGIIDALWHLLEKSQVISDDTFLAGWGEELHFYNRGVIKDEVGVSITIRGTLESDLQIQKKQLKPRTKKESKRSSSAKVKRIRKKTMDDGDRRSGK